LPAGADDATFKLLHLDVGLFCTSLGLELGTLERAEDLTLVNQGTVAEEAVGQFLRFASAANDEPRLFWWQREKHGWEAELDFVHALGSSVVPIEVKAGKTGTLRSTGSWPSASSRGPACQFGAARSARTRRGHAARSGELPLVVDPGLHCRAGPAAVARRCVARAVARLLS
jgi:hypothetical protein